MKADERKIADVLREQVQYEIPLYQRPYSWGKENVEQLLIDIWEAFKGQDDEYFIGAIITIEKDKDALYEVIDGQQRLTTLNLILARLRDAVSEPAKSELGKRLLPKNILTGEKGMPRLLLRQKERTFFQDHILEGQEIPATMQQKIEQEQDAPKLRILENLQIIGKFLANKNEKTLKLFANYLLDKVYVVFVTTNSQQSAVRLFNVLNAARGIPLSSADLIKNMLFGKLDNRDEKITTRKEKLNECWIELEEIIGIEQLNLFLEHHRHHLWVMSKQAEQAFYEHYMNLIKASNDPFKFLEEITASAKNYTRIRDNKFKDVGTRRLIRSLHRVAFNDWMPALLAFMNNPVEGISEKEFVELVEKITYQYWIRNLGILPRFTIYSQLMNTIREEKSAADIRAIFQQNARNEELGKLLDGVIYNKPFARAVLLRLEEASQDTSVSKEYGSITIEHVLPQALNDKYWKDRFSIKNHQLWLHRLGNLTLLGSTKNHKAQAHSFDLKKKVYNSFQGKTSFDMTKSIVNKKNWSINELTQRHKEMLKSAISIWEIS